jgi:Phage endonuclease I.
MSAYSARQIARKHGYRSGLEHSLADYLTELSVKFLYEKVKIEWEDLTYRTYTPDFILPNGIIIETKGRFTAIDRRKHVCIKRQHPELDIRFVFTNSRSKIRKGAKSNYADWCIKHGFRYYDRIIPEDWLKEKKKKRTKHKSFITFKGKKRRKI